MVSGVRSLGHRESHTHTHCRAAGGRCIQLVEVMGMNTQRHSRYKSDNMENLIGSRVCVCVFGVRPQRRREASSPHRGCWTPHCPAAHPHQHTPAPTHSAHFTKGRFNSLLSFPFANQPAADRNGRRLKNTNKGRGGGGEDQESTQPEGDSIGHVEGHKVLV